MYRKTITLLMMAIMAVSTLAADGDVRTTTVGGIEWTFTVVSESSKTCELGGQIPSQYDHEYCTAIPTTVTGSVTTPTSLDGYKVTGLYSRSFRECEISSITISPGVTIVGEKAFFGCYNLTSVVMPEGVTHIGEEAFSECPITSIVLPESLVRIGEQAFEHTKLTTITLPKNVAYLGNEDRIDDYDGSIIEEDDLYGDVFNGCNRLQEVKVVPENQTYADIDGVLFTKDLKAFLYCPHAKDVVTIPNSVTSIGNRAFYNCSGLTSIAIPNSVTSIGYEAFMGCTGLTRIDAYLNPVNVTWVGYFVFIGVPMDGTLHVLPQYIEAYQTTYPWNYFTNIVGDLSENILVTGEVDGSGIVDVDDVNAMINLILNYDQYKDRYPGNADLDGSGIVDVDDVNALINIILNN